MKKVLYIIHSSKMGGATISFLNMVCGMKKVGYIPIIVYPDYNETFINILNKNGLKHMRTQLTPLILKTNSLKDKILYPYHFINLTTRLNRTIKSFEKIVKLVEPDIIHTNTGIIHEGYFAAKKIGIPHVWHLREYQDLDFSWRIYPSKKEFIKELSTSNVIAISQGIFNHFQLSNTKDRVIYNGILHETETTYIPQKKKYFLCASRIVSSKGHEDVVKAFASFSKEHPDFRLIILGNGHKRFIEHLNKLAEKMKCKDQIRFEGHKTVHETVKYMQEALALIVASKFEGFGRMTAEAAFAGCFVLGRDTGGTKEIIEHTNGILFHDANGLLQAMNDIASLDKETYTRRVIQGQNLAVKTYSIEKNIQHIAQFYSFILKNNRITD